jgi:hypothetical protein
MGSGLSYREDLTQELRDWVYSWFRKNPRVEAYIEAVGATAQMVEDDMFDVLLDSFLSSASGQTLDNIGSWMGEQRQGLNDSEYRRVLFAKRRSQQSDGELPDLLDLVAALTDDETPEAYPAYPAAFRIAFTSDASDAFLARLKRMFGPAVKLGVGWELLRSEGSPFTFDVDGLGFDDGNLVEIL